MLLGCGDDTPALEDDGGLAPQTPWTVSTPMPAPVQETAVVAVDGRVWVLGGFEGRSGETSAVRIYDPAADSWTNGPDLPMRAHHLGAGVVDGDIYVLGGLTDLGFTATGAAWKLDNEASAWTDIAPMPTGTERGAGIVAAVDGILYVVGGLRGGMAVPDVSAYDPVGDTWDAQLSPLPEARDHLVGATVGGSIYAVGGRAASIAAISGRVDRYDPVNDAWQPAASMVTPRAGAAAAVVQGRILVAGGEGSGDGNGVFAEVESYDPDTDTWESLAAMRTPRHGTGAAGIGSTFIVPGGADVQGFGAVDTVEMLETSPP